MGAPGGVEPPTNGLGNRGFHPSLNRIINLQVGLGWPNRIWITSNGGYLATHLATVELGIECIRSGCQRLQQRITSIKVVVDGDLGRQIVGQVVQLPCGRDGGH